MATTSSAFQALVSHPPVDGQINLQLEQVTRRPVGPDELVVRIVATGVCHSDIHYASQSASQGTYPRVLGHEGAGYIVEVGSGVTAFKPDEPVLLSFTGCGTCRRCSEGHPCFCTVRTNKHLGGEAGVFRTAQEGQGVHGLFFGQSSFANYTIVKQGAAVNVSGLVKDEDDLRLFAAIVCGFQTGAGSIINVAHGRKEDSVVVTGTGGVGLGAIVAARVLGSKTIVAVDTHKSRLEAARKLGATHTLLSGANFNLAEEVFKVTAGAGASIVLDTTGSLPLIESGVAATEDGGRFVHVGLPNPIGAELKIPLHQFLAVRKHLPIINCSPHRFVLGIAS
ncbi:hypothetical protein A1O3_04443 [Capronia epimyces CBS 606.96]|uniref:Enoyl reductase (ER) domain-containing protein n=1 Tax=Capronia epimyces CBS 606.96 TaxID=1182542 RepID=W9Y4Q6_9EURO|nr:uncharacterized protein A1O3_04443 [Capronia epimyces CBS 606.96]EXJ87483.1 hypothetical protein A1O3_04443 [Capronia epimyces CBS 606.96]